MYRYTYCIVCYSSIHRKGNRRSHVFEKWKKNEEKNELMYDSGKSDDNLMNDRIIDNSAVTIDEETSNSSSSSAVSAAASSLLSTPYSSSDVPLLSGLWFEERSKYIPVRLSLYERKILRF